MKRALELLLQASPGTCHRTLKLDDEEEGEINEPPRKASKLKPKELTMKNYAIDAPEVQNDDEDSVFRHVAGYSKGGNVMNQRNAMTLMSVTDGEGFKTWCKKHLNESTIRAQAFLIDICEERGIPCSKGNKIATLVTKIAKDFDEVSATL